MPPWKLQHLPYPAVRDAGYEVALLPIGACEPHNLHLPHGTDAYESELVSDRVCEAAWQLGAKVVQLPTMPYGVQSNMLDVPLAINVYPSTMFALLKDITDALEGHGIRKLVLFNSHGVNDFLKPFVREMGGRSMVFISVIDWWKVGKDQYAQIFTHPDDHAGELETSVMLALAPQLVRLDQAADGASNPTRFDAVNQGWVSISRPWKGLTQSTGVGNPRQATKEKGERYLSVVVPRLAQYIAELSKADVDDANFPF